MYILGNIANETKITNLRLARAWTGDVPSPAEASESHWEQTGFIMAELDQLLHHHELVIVEPRVLYFSSLPIRNSLVFLLNMQYT